MSGKLCEHCGNPLAHHPMTFKSKTFGTLTCSGQADLECTGVAARWCPIHGDCTCSKGRDLNDPKCPLHSAESTHAEATL